MTTAPRTDEASARLRNIEGRHNAQVKELRRAFDHGDAGDGFCAVEGLRILEEAIRSGVRLKTVFFRTSAKHLADRLLPQIGAQVETLMLPDKLFDGAVPSETPQGVAALIQVRAYTLEEMGAGGGKRPIVVAVGVQDPGNLGTIIRSAEGFHSAGLILAEGTVSHFNAKAVRASAGSFFRLPVSRSRVEQIIPALRASGMRLVATAPHRGEQIDKADLSGGIAIFIGGEGAGLPKTLLSQMDQVVAIPQAEGVESLNAGVAASIVLYEVNRQRNNRTK